MDDLRRLLYQMADDELILGHRCSEWLGLGPHIEEDIAFASIAQDELGHAAALYRLLQELGEGDADDLAFGRPPAARQNARFVERPHGEGSYLDNPNWDWADLLWRHFLYDEFDAVRLSVAAQSSYQPLAQLAGKISREERYHRLHHQTWLKRLTETEEGKARLAAALPAVWAEVGGLFSLGGIRDSALFPATSASLWAAWAERVAPSLEAWGLLDLVAGTEAGSALPAADQDGRLGHHTADLGALLATMSEVRNTAPGANW
jgi:ring-1,2-phenylacetyl-CoA epoxidase subunit PaaC